jgi:hypothetical protein
LLQRHAGLEHDLELDRLVVDLQARADAVLVGTQFAGPCVSGTASARVTVASPSMPVICCRS